MGLWDYLKSWDNKPVEGDSRKNASGADSDATPYDGGVPYRWDMPETPEWGIGDKGQSSGGYGHSEACKDVGGKDTAWGMSQADIAAGYEKPKSDGEGGTLETRQPYGSYPQSVPSSNEWDRGAGSDSYAREHSATTGRGFDGRGKPESTSNPGGESLGSSKLPS